MTALDVASINEFQDVYAVLQLMDPPSTEYTQDEDDLEVISHETIIQLHWIRNLSNPDTLIVLNLSAQIWHLVQIEVSCLENEMLMKRFHAQMKAAPKLSLYDSDKGVGLQVPRETFSKMNITFTEDDV